MNCLKTKLFFAFLILLGTNFVFADNLKFDSTTHNYVVEYQKPVQGSGNVSALNCIFTDQISVDKAEEFLMEQTKMALKFQQPSGQLMAYAWLQTNGDESMIQLKDGSDFLIFDPKLNKILTEKAYSIAIAPKPNSNGRIDVSFDVSLIKTPDGKVKISGKTNLPDEMELMLSLRNKASGYFAQDKVSVLNGKFESAGFSKQGDSLPVGNYDVSVSSPLPDLEPASVTSVIGKNGENLTGEFMESSMGSNMVNFEKQLALN
ncbi:MAG TPA: hypothetical protein VK810_06180 [Dongiaceae bacterium]|jgi:hypothetical protein|nr:hypothetical protein [Dongiaceae bacterium]